MTAAMALALLAGIPAIPAQAQALAPEAGAPELAPLEVVDLPDDGPAVATASPSKILQRRRDPVADFLRAPVLPHAVSRALADTLDRSTAVAPSGTRSLTAHPAAPDSKVRATTDRHAPRVDEAVTLQGRSKDRHRWHMGSGSITGRVTGPTGASAVGACVYALSEHGHTQDDAVTNSTGNYTLSGLVGGAYRVMFAPCRAGNMAGEYYSKKALLASANAVNVTDGAATSGINAQLAAGGSISGKVTNSAGNPVAGACIHVNQLHTEQQDFRGTVLTDTAGNYVIGLGAGSYKVAFTACNGSNLAPEYWNNARDFDTGHAVVVTTGAVTPGINASMATGGIITGTVTDAAGSSMRGVCVNALPVGGGFSQSAETAANGTYSISQIQAGGYKVEFNACSATGPANSGVQELSGDRQRHEDAVQIRVNAGATVPGVNAQLARGGTITGKVTGPGGVGVPEICVFAVPLGIGTATSGFTAPDGTYSIHNVRPGRHRLAADACSGQSFGRSWLGNELTYESSALLTTTAGTTTSNINFSLTPTGSISGVVTGPTGTAVAGACVYAFNGIAFGQATTTANGSYTIAQMPPGSYEVDFDPCGAGNFVFESYSDRWDRFTPVSVTSGATTSAINARFETAAGLRGTLRRPGGQPLPGICVTADEVGTGNFGFAVSDAAGNYLVTGLQPGHFEVQFARCDTTTANVQSETFSAIRRGQSVTPPRVEVNKGSVSVMPPVTLIAGGSITGTVTGASGRVAGVCIEVVDSEGTQAVTVTDGDGLYRVDGLDTGTSMVRADPCGSAANLAPTWYNGKTRATATPVSVTAGATTSGINVTLPASSTIGGTVSAPAGVARDGLCASTSGAEGSQSSLTLPGGSYRLYGLPAGTYTVRFSSCDNANLRDASSGAVTVAAGASALTANASMLAGGTVTGVVQTASAAPVLAACVDLWRVSSGIYTFIDSVVTARGGRFTMNSLPSGTYTLHFIPCFGGNLAEQWFNNKFSQAASNTVAVSAGGAPVTANATMAAGGTITGQVRNKFGTALPGMCVNASDAVTSDFFTTVGTNGTGRFVMDGLPARGYKLSFAGCSGHDHFRGQYFNNQANESSAATLNVTAGSTTANINANLAALFPVAADFNGDRTSDIAVWRPSNSRWYIRGLGTVPAVGASSSIPVAADYDGDGDVDIAAFAPSTGAWTIEERAAPVTHGVSGDVPVPADYDGDGDDDIAVYRPSTGRWIVLGATSNPQWGLSTDIPVPADYDGDGDADMAVWRPSTGRWYVLGAPGAPQWGLSSDRPVPADYDGDGIVDMAVWRPSTGAWFVLGVGEIGRWGLSSDIPVPGDYDGDGRAEMAVWRPSTGVFYPFGAPSASQWGLSTDIPVARPPALR